MVLYTETSKESIKKKKRKKLLELFKKKKKRTVWDQKSFRKPNHSMKINCFSIHLQGKLQKWNQDYIPLTPASEIIKYLGVNLTKEVQDLYSEN